MHAGRPRTAGKHSSRSHHVPTPDKISGCGCSTRTRHDSCWATHALPGRARFQRLNFSSDWVFDREAVDIEQLLDTSLRVKPLLVSPARLLAEGLVLLGIPLDITDRQRKSGWITGAEQYAVDPWGDQLGE